MATKSRIWSDSPAHPGGLLLEELVARDLSVRAAAAAMQMSQEDLMAVCEGRQPLSAGLAWSLETLFGDISARFWMGLQADYDLAVERLRRTN